MRRQLRAVAQFFAVRWKDPMERWILILRGVYLVACVAFGAFQLSLVRDSYEHPLTRVSEERQGHAPGADIVVCPFARIPIPEVSCVVLRPGAPHWSCAGRLSRVEGVYTFLNIPTLSSSCYHFNGGGLSLSVRDLVVLGNVFSAADAQNASGEATYYQFAVTPTGTVGGAEGPLVEVGNPDILVNSSIEFAHLPAVPAANIPRAPVMVGDLEGATTVNYQATRYEPLRAFGSAAPIPGMQATATNAGPLKLLPSQDGKIRVFSLSMSAASARVLVTTEVPQTSVPSALAATGGFISLGGTLVVLLVGRGEYQRDGWVQMWLDKRSRGRRRAQHGWGKFAPTGAIALDLEAPMLVGRGKGGSEDAVLCGPPSHHESK